MAFDVGLTRDDCNTLLESLEAWENKDLAGDLLISMLDASLPPAPGDSSRKTMKESWDERERQTADAKRMRKERSIILKSKLLLLRDKIEADAMIASALR